MARKRSLGRQNPPQIHMYTEGQTEVLYFNQLKNILGLNLEKN